jgi:hypothetical protein
MTVLGNVGSDVLRIETEGETVLELQVRGDGNRLAVFLKDKLQAEAMAAGAE